MPHIWIIDDERAICWSLKKAFESVGHTVSIYSNAEEALLHLNRNGIKGNGTVDAIMLDVRLPGMDGFQAAWEIKERAPAIPIIMMTAFGDLSTAVQAMQLEVMEYLTKPFDLRDAMRSIQMAIDSNRPLDRSFASGSSSLENEFLMGDSPAMQSVYKKIAIAARSDVSVLIVGAPGTGKESVAAAIHRNSTRSDRPFVPILPSAYPPATLERELLGIQSPDTKRPGEFRSGILELAGDGSIYIDEVGDLSPLAQTQLLRILEHKQFVPIGGVDSKPCRARIMASSSRNLELAIGEGELQQALVARLNVFSIELPPLASRPEDILPIARSIVAQRSQGRSIHFSEDAEAWMERHDWHDNVRELRMVIEHAMAIVRGHVIFAEHFPTVPKPKSNESSSSLGRLLESHVHQWVRQQRAEGGGTWKQSPANSDVFGTIYEDYMEVVEPPLIRAMLECCEGNKASAAYHLGLHRSTLRHKMRRHHID